MTKTNIYTNCKIHDIETQKIFKDWKIGIHQSGCCFLWYVPLSITLIPYNQLYILSIIIKQMPFYKILVPFDASELSINAVEQAIELARENQTQVCILPVVRETPLTTRFSRIELRNQEVVISPYS